LAGYAPEQSSITSDCIHLGGRLCFRHGAFFRTPVDILIFFFDSSTVIRNTSGIHLPMTVVAGCLRSNRLCRFSLASAPRMHCAEPGGARRSTRGGDAFTLIVSRLLLEVLSSEFAARFRGACIAIAVQDNMHGTIKNGQRRVHCPGTGYLLLLSRRYLFVLRLLHTSTCFFS